MSLLAVKCKHNSDRQETHIPAIVAYHLGHFRAISGEVACFTAFLAFNALGWARLGAFGALVSGFCIHQICLNCDVIGCTYSCNYGTDLGRSAQMGSREHDVPLSSLITMDIVGTQTGHLLDPQRKHLSPTRSTSTFSWGQSRAAWPSSVHNVSKLRRGASILGYHCNDYILQSHDP